MAKSRRSGSAVLLLLLGVLAWGALEGAAAGVRVVQDLPYTEAPEGAGAALPPLVKPVTTSASGVDGEERPASGSASITDSGAAVPMRRDGQETARILERAKKDVGERMKPYFAGAVLDDQLTVIEASAQAVAGRRVCVVFQGSLSKLKLTSDKQDMLVEVEACYLEPLRVDASAGAPALKLETLRIYYPDKSAWADVLLRIALERVNHKRTKSDFAEITEDGVEIQTVFQTLYADAQAENEGVFTYLCLSRKNVQDGEPRDFEVLMDQPPVQAVFELNRAMKMRAVRPAGVTLRDERKHTATFMCSAHEVRRFAEVVASGGAAVVPSAVEDHGADPDTQSTTVLVEEQVRAAASARRNLRSAQLHGDLLAKMGTPPEQFDWREQKSECTPEIEYPSNQGGCGSCYAFAATTAATIRSCIGGMGGQSRTKSLSPHDVLSCGTITRGSTCINFSGKGKTMDYADGCDGGSAFKIFEFAAERGMYDEECHPYTFSGDPISHFSGNHDSSDPPQCVLTYHGSEGGRRVSCGRSYLTLSGNRPTRVPIDFCTCPRNQRKGYEDIEVQLKQDLQCIVDVENSNGGCKVTCDENIREKQAFQASLKGDGKYVVDPKFCRCNTDSWKVEGCSAKTHEKGSGAVKQCKRHDGSLGLDSRGSVDCTKPRRFHSPRQSDQPSESLIKLAIMDGGPVVASIEARKDLQDFNSNGVYRMNPRSPVSGGHAIVLFGWGQSSKHGKFWWAKNSWGGDWPHKGANGIFRMARGIDTANVESRGISWVYAGEKPKKRATWCEVPIRNFEDLNSHPAGKCVELKQGSNRRGRSVCEVTNRCKTALEVDLYQHSDGQSCGRYFRPFEIRAGGSQNFEGAVNCCIRSAEPVGGGSGGGGFLDGLFGGGGDDDGNNDPRGRGGNRRGSGGGGSCLRAVQHHSGNKGCEIENNCPRSVQLKLKRNPSSHYEFRPGQRGMVRERCNQLSMMQM